MPLSAETRLGIGKEATWAAGAAPARTLPVEPFTITFNFENIKDTSLRGELATNFGVYQGVYHVEGSLEGNFYPEELGHLLLTTFGTDSVATATQAPWEHTFTLDANPPSLAIIDDNGVQEYMYKGVYINEFGFKFNAAEGLLTWTAGLMGKAYTTTSATVADATAINPFVGWMATVTKGTNTTFGKLIEFDATLARDVSMVYTARNSQEAYTAYVGPMEASGTMTIIFDDEDDLNLYLDNTNEYFSIAFTQGTGTTEKGFTFEANKMSYANEAAEINRSEVDLRLTLNWTALHNATDGGPCQVQLKSSTNTY